MAALNDPGRPTEDRIRYPHPSTLRLERLKDDLRMFNAALAELRQEKGDLEAGNAWHGVGALRGGCSLPAATAAGDQGPLR